MYPTAWYLGPLALTAAPPFFILHVPLSATNTKSAYIRGSKVC